MTIHWHGPPNIGHRESQAQAPQDTGSGSSGEGFEPEFTLWLIMGPLMGVLVLFYCMRCCSLRPCQKAELRSLLVSPLVSDNSPLVRAEINTILDFTVQLPYKKGLAFRFLGWCLDCGSELELVEGLAIGLRELTGRVGGEGMQRRRAGA